MEVDAPGTAYDVRFTEVHDEADLAAADAGHRAKHGHHASSSTTSRRRASALPPSRSNPA